VAKLRAPGTQAVKVRHVSSSAAIEDWLRSTLQTSVKAMHDSMVHAIKRTWRKLGLPLTPEDKEKKKARDAILSDGPMDELNKIMARAGKQWVSHFNALSTSLVKRFVDKSIAHHDGAFSAALKDAGFAVKFSPTEKQRSAVTDFIEGKDPILGPPDARKGPVDLIRSIPEEYHDQIKELVEESFQKGRDLKTLTDKLQERFNVTRNRAALIARDQNNKCTAILHKIRQGELGIKKAYWIHSMGSKHPREEHAQWYAENRIYNIDEGMYSEVDEEFVWPGTAISCGCTAMSVIPGMDEEGEEGGGEKESSSEENEVSE
jgi:hypothetical protein